MPSPIVPNKDFQERGILSYKVYPVSVLDENIHIVICRDVETARSHSRFVDLFGPFEGEACGLCSYSNDRTAIVVFIGMHTSESGIIAHEAVHAARALLDKYGITLTKETNEMFATMVEKIVGMCDEGVQEANQLHT